MKHILYAMVLACLLMSFPACKHKNKNKDKTENVKEEEQVTQGNKYPMDSAEVMGYLVQWGDTNKKGRSVLEFYANNNYYPAWSEKGELTPQAGAFLDRLKSCREEGLDSSVFRISSLEILKDKAAGIFKKEGDVENKPLHELDVLLTHQFYEYAGQLMEGRTRGQKKNLNWFVADPNIAYDSVLRVVLKDEENKDPFVQLEPPHAQYQLLKKALASYRNYAAKGGWPLLQGAKKLKMGDTSDNVVKLRERLSITGDFRPSADNFYNPRIFDRNLDLAVRDFQTRNGIEPDGVVGGGTLEALNVPVDQRIKSILVNMERWRMVPRNFGKDYLIVNVPEFRLRIIEDEKEKFSMRVVVGKEFKATPVFNDVLQYVVLSPYWNVPKSITAEEILPLMYKNPNYLSSHNMEVIKGWGDKMEVVPAWTVPWGQIDEPGFQYWVRQGPGPDNPLGLVKFLFPNNHNVYLHDTPSDHLFARVKRNFSHGCIRLEQPQKLAEYLLQDVPGWNRKKIEEAMKKGEEQFVKVTPRPVYIFYFTTWVGKDGKLQIREDIYNMDKPLASLI